MSKQYDLSQIVFPSDKLISDAGVAKNYIDNIYMAHGKLWDMIKAMEEHIDGKKPKDPEKLKASGKLWAANYNYGKARSKLEVAVSKNVDSILNSLLLMSIGFKHITDKELEDEDLAFLENVDLKDMASRIIESVLNECIDRDLRIVSFLNTLEYNTTAWGWGAATKDHRSDWMGEAHHVRAIGFEDKAKPESIPGFVTFDTIEGKELWRTWTKYKNSEHLTEEEDTDNQKYKISPSGWIIEGLEESLFYSYNGKTDANGKVRDSLTSFEEILPEYIKRPSNVIVNTTKVAIATIYTFEMETGKVTTTRIAYGNGWKGELNGGSVTRHLTQGNGYNRMSQQSPKFLLYQKTEKVDSQDDVISLVFDSGFTTNGYIQEMRGLAKYAVEDSIRFNRSKNDIGNKLLFSGSPYIQRVGNNTGDAGPQIAPSQGFAIVGKGYAFMPDQPRFDLSNHITAIQMEEGHYQRETDHYDPKVSGKLSSRPVRSEVDVISGEVRSIEGVKIQIKLRCYGKIFLGMLKGLCYHLDEPTGSIIKDNKEALTGFEFFKEQCKVHLKVFNIDNDKKLKKLLSLVDTVSLEKALSDPDAIIEQLNQAETPYDRLRLNRMLMVARGFSRKEVTQRYPLNNYPTSQMEEWMASQENAMFSITAEVLFSHSHNPIAHLNIHLPKCFGLLDAIISSKDDPIPNFNWLNRLAEHSGFHIDSLLKAQYIQESTQQKYLNGYKQILQAIAELKPQIEAAAKRLKEEQAQAQGQAQPQIDPQVQAKIQGDQLKLQNNIQIKQVQSEFRAQEKSKDNELRRKMTEETHKDKLRRSQELDNLKKDLAIMRESVKLASM